jgi:predicted TIM-barrel fold metal-dependent hydrolase
MLQEMDAAGVDRAVIVPPTWAGDDNTWALGIAARYPDRFAVVGRFDATARGARHQLARWLDQPHMLGVRMSFHVKPFIDWLDDGSLDWFWTACERHEIPVMALVPGMTGKIRPIAERHPDLPILIPHMGFGLDARGAPAFASLTTFWHWRAFHGLSSTYLRCPAFLNNSTRSVTPTRSFAGSTMLLVRGGCCGEPTSAGCAAAIANAWPSFRRRSTS